MRTWDLFREMEQFQKDLDDVFRGIGLGSIATTNQRSLRSFPRLNLREDDENLYVEALLPGIDPQHVEISMLGNTLTLSGERSQEELKVENGRWHRRERPVGNFMRTVELPAEVDQDKAYAEAKHGLLRITLPKAAVAKPKAIAIKANG